MQGLSTYLRGASGGLGHNLRLVGGRVLVETAILAASVMPFVLGLRSIKAHLALVMEALPLTLQPGQLIAADLFLFVTSSRFLFPLLGLMAAAALLAAGLRFGQRSAEIGVLASWARGDDHPPRGFFESLVGYFDRSVVVGALEAVALLATWGWAFGILLGGFSFWNAARGASAGLGVLASLILAAGMTLVLAVAVVVHAIFPLAVTGSIAAGWRPTSAPARALSLLGRRPFMLLAAGGVILGVRIAVALLVGSAATFVLFLPPEALVAGPGLWARGVETLIGLFAGGVVTVFSYGLLTGIILDDAGLLPIPAPPATPAPRPQLPEDTPAREEAPVHLAVLVEVPVVYEAQPVEAAEADSAGSAAPGAAGSSDLSGRSDQDPE